MNSIHPYLNDLSHLDYLLSRFVFPFVWKVLGAFVVWFAGGIVIRVLKRLATRAMERKHIDPTLVRYANSTLGLILRCLIVVAILAVFGIETTSFSAILAAAGVAIGVAWSGLLANFAAGVFLVVLRPFKVGDTISAAGVTGTVQEIGLFATSLDNGDNLRIFVPNNKLFSDNIQNSSRNPYRLASFRVQIARAVSPNHAMDLLAKALQTIPGALGEPKVGGSITEFNTLGTVITLQVPCSNAFYWQVLAAGNDRIFQTLKEANFPAPENRTVWIQSNEAIYK